MEAGARGNPPALSIRQARLKARPMTAPKPKDWIMAIHPYVPGKSTTDDGRKVSKLSSNENPLGTSEVVRAEWARHAHALERYPDASAAALRETIAEANGLDPARIIYGTGSDEVLHLVAGAYAGQGDEIIFVKYGFSVYEIAARRVGARRRVWVDRRAPLRQRRQLRPDRLNDHVARDQLVWGMTRAPGPVVRQEVLELTSGSHLNGTGYATILAQFRVLFQ
jgi:hypothetical protein